MNVKKILFALSIAALLIGSACAASSIGGFKIDEKYDSAYNATDYSMYLNGKNDGGITIYDTVDADSEDDDNLYENLVHDDGHDYIIGDEDFKIDVNKDKTANFTDYDHAQHGVSELVKKADKEYIIVFWAKDGSDIENSKLASELQKFNKDNNITPIEF